MSNFGKERANIVFFTKERLCLLLKKRKKKNTILQIVKENVWKELRIASRKVVLNFKCHTRFYWRFQLNVYSVGFRPNKDLLSRETKLTDVIDKSMRCVGIFC